MPALTPKENWLKTGRWSEIDVLFKFKGADMTLQTGIVEVLMALNPVFESWEMAYWFAQPNRWLENGSKPADLIRTDAHAVLRAACSDRFIAH